MFIEMNDKIVSLRDIKTVSKQWNIDTYQYYINLMYRNDSSLVYLKYSTEHERDTDYEKLKKILLFELKHEYV